MDWKTINSRYVHPAIEAARAGRVDEAERLFKEGLAASHEDGYVALRFAEFLESLKRSDDAVRLFELALRKLPKPEHKLKPKEGLDGLSSAPRRFAMLSIDIEYQAESSTSSESRGKRI